MLIAGDLHGQLEDLLLIFYKVRTSSNIRAIKFIIANYSEA